jgi:hypothetical protein
VSEGEPVEAAILRLTAACGPARSVTPEDVARALAPDNEALWRSKLSAVRRAAIRLAGEGRIDILRKGKPVPPGEVRGVIRLRAPCPT